MKLDEALEILHRTPAVLANLLAGIGEPWTDANEGPDTFSPRDVLGHLISGEESDWIARARIILEHGTAKPFDPFDRFGFRERYGKASVPELLERFAELRRENLRVLGEMKLTDELLARPGTHPELGAVTLGQLLATWTVHDLNHIAQIVRVMARRYVDEVGPWRAYLGILPKG